MTAWKRKEWGSGFVSTIFQTRNVYRTTGIRYNRRILYYIIMEIEQITDKEDLKKRLLSFINEIREEHGYKPIDFIPEGTRYSCDFSPISYALKMDGGFEYATSDYYEPFTEGESYGLWVRVQPRGGEEREYKKDDKHLAEFMAGFDQGFFPELDDGNR